MSPLSAAAVVVVVVVVIAARHSIWLIVRLAAAAIAPACRRLELRKTFSRGNLFAEQEGTRRVRKCSKILSRKELGRQTRLRKLTKGSQLQGRSFSAHVSNSQALFNGEEDRCYAGNSAATFLPIIFFFFSAFQNLNETALLRYFFSS